MMRRRLYLSLLAVIIVVLAGTVGFSIMMGLSLLDAFYFTIVTISTVGYGEIYPTTPETKLFASFLIIVGLGSITVFLETAVEDILRRSIKEAMGEPEVEKPTKDHYIICGYSDLGEVVVEELVRLGERFVVIEQDGEKVRELLRKGIPAIQGDACKEDTLTEAGIRKAKGVATIFEDDIKNVFVLITAKSINPKLHVVARANHFETVDKMYKIGADLVISPEVEGGRMIAKALVKPDILKVIDRMVLTKDVDAVRFFVDHKSVLEGETIKSAKIEETGVKVAAITRRGEVRVTPDSGTKLEEGDVLLLIGEKEKLKKFQEKYMKKEEEK